MQISHVARRTVGQPEDLSDQPYILVLVRGLCLKMYPHKGFDKEEHTLSARGIGNQKTLWKVLFAARNQETNDQCD